MKARLKAASSCFFSALALFLCAQAHGGEAGFSERDAALLRELEAKAEGRAQDGREMQEAVERAGKAIEAQRKALEADGSLTASLQHAQDRASDLAENGKGLIFSNESVAALERQGRARRLERERRLAGARAGGMAPPSASGPEYDTLIFISYGLDKETIRQLYQINAGSARTALVVRGLPKGTATITQAIQRIQEIARDLKLDPPPNVVLNPVWFQQYGITKVPTAVALKAPTQPQSGDQATGKARPAPEVVARAEGIIDPEWLRQRITLGDRGDLGVRGPVAEIEERDLIDEMKERAAKIDWAGKKKRAIARAWENIPIETLEKAHEYRLRVIDPTFTVLKDITAPDPHNPGKTLLIAKRGQKVNPLLSKPFNRLLVVFDPTDRKEAEFVRARLKGWEKEHRKGYAGTRLVMSGFDRSEGWDGYNKLVESFGGRPLYTLQKELRSAFALERHPCIAYAVGTRFVVEEFDVSSGK